MAIQVIDCVKKFHKKSIALGNIETKNILITDQDDIYLLGQYEAFNPLNDGNDSIYRYIIPSLKEHKYIKDASFKTDIRAIGAVFLEMYTGKRLSDQDFQFWISAGRSPPYVNDIKDGNIRDFIFTCLN